MKKIGICGAFGFVDMAHGGQPVKTREVYYAFCEKYGKDNVNFLETYHDKNYIKLFFKSFLLIKNCEHVAILPARNGIKIFAPLYVFFNKIFKRKLHYFVVGGWLPQLVEKNKFLRKQLKKFNTIFVETNSMKEKLEKQGFTNVIQNENFRNSKPVENVKYFSEYPVKLCFFSRVVKQKGILDAIDVVNKINADKCVCNLDIYGIVSDDFKDEFENTLKKCGSFITYKGFVDAKKSIETLKEYDLHIFPTRYKTEGIPGSIVDSYFAGVPVVSSKWNSFNDVIKEGITGVGYEFEDANDFEEKLTKLLDNPEKINEMKENCIKESEKYMTKNAMSKIEKYFD